MPYQPLYKWGGPKIDQSDQPTDLDWLGYDGEIIIGRIRTESGGPKSGQWQWSALGPKPHQGFEAEPREAMRKAEDYYHRLMRKN
ncbi:hypothetical protein Rleg4DRAFT_4382 [Rhizobium leguminosarum bv. trifolii WSM2297]|uniref:Uncharacterized protein n=1 Tax=Rhizobium leguminosarum bv. trifolii WSM2297 TaxID=754762 RepID=J0WBR4_RHILT|nr:hypothetical protein Rleg4DRAFT_4382 [Rhizobium leguminosarum bv. trifolii WSM2297]